MTEHAHAAAAPEAPTEEAPNPFDTEEESSESGEHKRHHRRGPSSFPPMPPGFAGWVISTLFGRRAAGVIVIVGASIALVIGILWGRAIVADKFEGVAAAAVKPIAAKQKRDHKAIVRLEGKIELIGEAVLSKQQRDDPRWREHAAIQDDEGDDQ